MRTNHVTLFIFLVMLHNVTCQVDMFELHDKERGDVTMHVTRDSANIEAVSDSVSLVMNPFGAVAARSLDSSSTKRDNNTVAPDNTAIAAITRDNDTTGGYTIGNLDQRSIDVKDNNDSSSDVNNNINSNNNNNNNSNSSSLSLSAANTDLLPSLPASNRFIHVDQDDYNVKRSKLPTSLFGELPTSLFGKLPDDEPKHKVTKVRLKRRFRPRPPCYEKGVKKTVLTNKGGDRLDILGDFNEIIETSARQKRMLPNADTRRDGELYNIHDGNQNKRAVSKSRRPCFCASKVARHFKTFARSKKVKDVNASKKSLLNIKAISRVHRNEAKSFSRLPEVGSTTLARLPNRFAGRSAKKSGIKEMKIHNELGAMHIKSNPSETAVLSESGNIEITMLNDAGSSSKIGAGAKAEIPRSPSNRYMTGTSRTLGENNGANKENVAISHPKKRLHLAEDISLKKSKVNINSRHIVRI